MADVKPIKTNPQIETVQRLMRWPLDTDKWLDKTARERGFSTTQDFVRHIIREAREADRKKVA